MNGTAMKLATMTLAIFFGSDDGADWVRDRTRALAEKHPSRVVVLDASTHADERVVDLPRGASEWIEVGVQSMHAGELDALLTRLRLPDAPLVLLWIAESLAEDERFLALADRADDLICSTSVVRIDERPLRDLCAFIEAHPETPIQDVAYLRLIAWQELIAGFFDDPANRRELGELRSIEVSGGSDAEMYYLLGWIASRLDWKLVDRETFAAPSGNVHFTMQREGAPRRLASVILTSAGARFSARVHAEDPNAVLLSIEGTVTAPERSAPLHTVDLASLVERAILMRGRDHVFIESLAMARAIIERRVA